jgi:putative spermidine/putrescine transport system ATP-binding protein
LFPHLSLAENIAFPLRMRGTRRAAAHKLVANALDLVQLGQSGHAMPAEASPAERQRAMLARATVFAPKILLLDEPFSDQDAGSRGAMMASLRRIQQLLGATTLLATRNGNDALALADRLAVLRDGAIEQFGAPGEVFEHPRNDHVAAQLGEVNRLAGQVQSIDADIALIRLACGPRVEAQCGRALHQGDPCVVTLRPDRIALASIPAAEMGGNALDATLLEANFEGDSYRLRLLIGSGTELIARRPAAAGLRGFSPNAAVSVAWQAHHASAFRAS